MKVSNERLAEMLAGLEGVTPGPWHEGDHWVFVPPASGVTSHALENVLGSDKPQANAAHIARCDPDTMRAIITELQSFRNAQSEAGAVDGEYAWGLLRNTAEAICKKLESESASVTIFDQSALRESLDRVSALTHPAPPLAVTDGWDDLVRRLNAAADGFEKVSFERLSLRRGYEKLLREAATALTAALEAKQ